tara:strand:- start:42 stop:188 length:147 start_codon:yes stop_codon:yes gene_type:complete
LKTRTPKYIKFLVEKYPHITSGRKNHKGHHIRIIKTINLVKEYFKIKK